MGIYWHTLRFNRKNMTDDRKKIKNHWWDRGTDLAIVITTRCNLHCDYCPMFYGGNKYPKFKESTLEEWKEYFENYPEWINQIYITGGEPTLVSYLPELINWLIQRQHHVILFTNLSMPAGLTRIKNSWRFILIPTFHHSDDKERYSVALNKLNDVGYRIMSQELEDKKTFSFSRHKTKFTQEWFNNFNKLYHINPDAPHSKKLYLGCVALYKDGK